MRSKTTVLIPLDVEKSVDCMTERASFGIQGRKQWSRLKRLRKRNYFLLLR